MNTKILAALWAATLVAVMLFAVFVWPSMWRYDHVEQVPIRIHRVTGDTYVWSISGWQHCAARPPQAEKPTLQQLLNVP